MPSHVCNKSWLQEFSTCTVIITLQFPILVHSCYWPNLRSCLIHVQRSFLLWRHNSAAHYATMSCLTTSFTVEQPPSHATYFLNFNSCIPTRHYLTQQKQSPLCVQHLLAARGFFTFGKTNKPCFFSTQLETGFGLEKKTSNHGAVRPFAWVPIPWPCRGRGAQGTESSGGGMVFWGTSGRFTNTVGILFFWGGLGWCKTQ